jgi:hypothetical protein
LIGREVPIFRKFPKRHPFFKFNFFNPFLEKIPTAVICYGPAQTKYTDLIAVEIDYGPKMLNQMLSKFPY